MRISKIIFILIGFFFLGFSINAQEIEELQVQVEDTILQVIDTIPPVLVPDSVVESMIKSADSTLVAEGILAPLPTFKPNSTRAVIYSAIFPGLGQIYNRKYWKLPLVYGGFMGFMYAVTWNNKNYQSYSEAYRDILYDAKYRPDKKDEWNKSWQNYKTTTPTDVGFQNVLKGKKDFYRRYRDLSIILTAGFYFICMIDAYVDAEMFNFDISPDLSMRIEPVIAPRTSYSSQTYGLNCSIKF